MIEPGKPILILGTEADLKAYLAHCWSRDGELPPVAYVSSDVLVNEGMIKRLGAHRFLGFYWRAGSWPKTRRQIVDEALRSVPVSRQGEVFYQSDFGPIMLRRIL